MNLGRPRVDADAAREEAKEWTGYDPQRRMQGYSARPAHGQSMTGALDGRRCRCRGYQMVNCGTTAHGGSTDP